jgi:hypothetical protein
MALQEHVTIRAVRGEGTQRKDKNAVPIESLLILL